MARRFVSIWFPQLTTDWFAIRQPALSCSPFVLSAPSHGRMLITSANVAAQAQGIYTGMPVADARAIVPQLAVLDDIPDLPGKLLHRLAEWCIRFTPFVAADPPDGLFFDATGCAHLWGGEAGYLAEITRRLNKRGYAVQAAMAGTAGAAWAIARYGKKSFISDGIMDTAALLPLPPQSLRLETETIERLHKLGLSQIRDFITMPPAAMRRRFGQHFIKRLYQALGKEEEPLLPVLPVEPYQERLPALEPIVTAAGIEIALQRLLGVLCRRLLQEGKGLRIARFKCFCADGKTSVIETGTHQASCSAAHLFKLFESKLNNVEPGLGIELFILEALQTEDILPRQEKLWKTDSGLNDTRLSELLDRLEGKIGSGHIHRYLPDEHYWPERSIKLAASPLEKPGTAWRNDKPRPLHLLPQPEPVEVTAPIPDYPPMLFRYKGVLHKIIKADGPERIEQEWWMAEGQHRDYYAVEDEEGRRYWLFRSGHYTAEKLYQWFLHGFFA